MKTLKDFAPTVREVCKDNQWYGTIGYDQIQLVRDGVYLPVLSNLDGKVRQIDEPDFAYDKFLFHLY